MGRFINNLIIDDYCIRYEAVSVTFDGGDPLVNDDFHAIITIAHFDRFRRIYKVAHCIVLAGVSVFEGNISFIELSGTSFIIFF